MKKKKVPGMKKKKNPDAKPSKDFWRLASVHDILSKTGGVLIKKSPKATIYTAAITSSGYLSSYLGLPGFSGLETVATPFVVLTGMLGGGAALKYAPRMAFKKWTMIAQASDLNLMEDYKKSQVMEHLDALWDRVFWYESGIRYSQDERQTERSQILDDKEFFRSQISSWPEDRLERLGVRHETRKENIDRLVMALMTEYPLTDNMERSREGFIISSLFALKHALPQSSQAKNIGYRLNLLEDERDGAYFDSSDAKLFEQYIGNITLGDIKNEAGFGKIESLKKTPEKLSRRAWFYLITRKIAIETGKAVKYLNETYHTDVFNSQVLLWPGEEDAVDEFPGARDEVLHLREGIIRKTLGNGYDNAVVILDRMLLPCFELATDLRVRYDYEYCDGSLDHLSEDKNTTIRNNVTSDMEAYGYRQEDIDKMRKYAKDAKGDMSSFMDYLNAYKHELFDDKLALRVVRIAFHANRNGIREKFIKGRWASNLAHIENEIDNVIEEEPIYSSRLVGLRLHHQLTKLQISGYRNLVKELAYKD